MSILKIFRYIYMKCKIECFIAIAFLAGSFYTMTVDKSVFKKFYRMLNRKQKKIYTNIRMERLKIFIKGSLWGMLLSLAFKLAYGDNKNLLTMACTHSLLFSAAQYLYYNLHPKKDWMLMHLKEPKLIKMWLEKYKLMKGRWHFGLLMGIIGYGLLCFAIENNLLTVNKVN